MTASSAKDAAAAKGAARTFEPRITVDDLKRKAEQVRDVAQAEVKRVTADELTRTLVIAAVGVAVAVSFAYYLGSRRR